MPAIILHISQETLPRLKQTTKRVKHKLIPQTTEKRKRQSYIALLMDLVKSSGLYALSAIGPSLVSLVLAPFITHHLTPEDYGRLAILITLIGLGAGITQLGMGSAFFRAYSYDYTDTQERRSVLITVYAMLMLGSVPLALIVTIFAPTLAAVFFGQTTLSNVIVLMAVIVLLQNLTVPAFAWLRAENRAFLFTLASLGNLVVNTLITLLTIGIFHAGITGVLIGMGSGYAAVTLVTVPFILSYSRFRVRLDIARELLAFGLPLVGSFLSSWILQLSDRLLLGWLSTLTAAAHYAVAYSLGSVLGTLIIGPFTLAWPVTMFTIAKRKDAQQAFQLVFRWLGFLLLFAAFILSLAGTVVLGWLFPAPYHASAAIIPIIALSIAFNGIYYVFMVGANIVRKIWLTAIFTSVAAVVNFFLNLILIPLYGAMGAALATLAAYAILTALAYLANQRIYPVPFEIGYFIFAMMIGVAFYLIVYEAIQRLNGAWAWGFGISNSLAYGGSLIFLGFAQGRHRLANADEHPQTA